MDRDLFFKALNVAIFLGAVAGIIYPAFIDDKASLTQIFVSLFEPSWSLSFLMRWLVAFILVASLYVFFVGMYYRSVPITILNSNLELKYLSPDGSRVQFTRKQTLRANQRNVTAFFSTHTTSTANGRIPRAHVNVSAYCDSCDLADRIEIYGQESRSLEVIHIFGRPMPYAWFMPVVPVWLLGSEYDRLPKIFRPYVVSRSHSAIYENEFDTDPVMQFKAAAYPTFNAVISIDFTNTKLPVQRDIKAMRIKNYGVVDMQFEYNKNDKKIIFRINKLQNERLRITWPILGESKLPVVLDTP